MQDSDDSPSNPTRGHSEHRAPGGCLGRTARAAGPGRGGEFAPSCSAHHRCCDKICGHNSGRKALQGWPAPGLARCGVRGLEPLPPGPPPGPDSRKSEAGRGLPEQTPPPQARCTAPPSKQLSQLQRLWRALCFSSSIFIFSNLRPREARARVLKPSEPGRIDPQAQGTVSGRGHCKYPWKGWTGFSLRVRPSPCKDWVP